MFSNQRLVAVGYLLFCAFPLGLTAQDDVDALHQVLRSDASVQEKAVACERLAEVGTPQSVPILARFLDHDRLAHYARFGLEAIPDSSVDKLFRDSLDDLSGSSLIGVINSIGQRGDTEAVPGLNELMSGSDPQVAAAAAGALGRIGGARATGALLKQLGAKSSTTLKVAVADACLASAEEALARKRADRAQPLYEAVRQADVPQHLRVAATYAGILARGPEDLALLREQLRTENDAFFAVALQAAKQLQSDSVTEALVAELEKQSPDRQVVLVTVLSERLDPAALPAIRSAARSESDTVRLAVIRGLAAFGDSASAGRLMFMLSDSDEKVAQAALEAIAVLPGDEVDRQILSQLDQESSQRMEDLIRLAGLRRISGAIPDLKAATQSPRESIRTAAYKSLGETAGLDDLDFLIERTLDADTPEERSAAGKALTAACVRTVDRDACVKTVAARFSSAPVESQERMFELLREVGGEAALETVVAGARDRRDAVQDAASRVLGEWLTVDAAPQLLELTKAADSQKYKVRALRGYIRIIRQFGLPLEQRVEMSRRAIKAASRDDERKLVLEALMRFPAPESLEVAAEQLDQPGLKIPAAQAAVVIAEKMPEEQRGRARHAMQRVMEAGVGAVLTARAGAVLEQIE